MFFRLHGCADGGGEPGGVAAFRTIQKTMSRIILETQRLQLREMTLADLPSLAAVLQDERVMYAYEGAFSDAETALWMQSSSVVTGSMDSGFGPWC